MTDLKEPRVVVIANVEIKRDECQGTWEKSTFVRIPATLGSVLTGCQVIPRSWFQTNTAKSLSNRDQAQLITISKICYCQYIDQTKKRDWGKNRQYSSPKNCLFISCFLLLKLTSIVRTFLSLSSTCVKSTDPLNLTLNS